MTLPMNSIPVMNGDFPLVRLAYRSVRVALDPLSAPIERSERLPYSNNPC